MKLKRSKESIKWKELNNSALFDVHKWSNYPEVKSLVNSLFEEFELLPDFKGKKNLQKKHIKVVVLDLYDKWQTDELMYISFSRGSNAYEGDGRYNRIHISRLTPLVVDNLVRLGYVEQHKGVYSRDDYHNSYKSRMRATDKLIDLIINKEKVTPEMIEKATNTESIILRNKRKKDITYEDKDYFGIAKCREDLYAYNNLIRRRFIDIPNFPLEGVLSKSGTKKIKLNRTNKFVRRIFNNSSFEEGGRYYGGWWQNLPKDWRKEIVIDNYPTTEIDYSGLHIVILYALEGIDYWKTIATDPYQLKGFEQTERMRDFLKQVLLISINVRNKKSNAINAIENLIEEDQEQYAWVIHDRLDLGKLIDEFIRTHPPISKYFFSNFGVRLQNIDSQIAEHIINKMTERSKPVLCIHDSFIVGSSTGKALFEWMKESFNIVLRNLNEELAEMEVQTKEIGIDEDSWNKMLTMEGLEDLKIQLDKINSDKDLLDRWNVHKKTKWERNYYKDIEINYKELV
jgi:hypothetical protein